MAIASVAPPASGVARSPLRAGRRPIAQGLFALANVIALAGCVRGGYDPTDASSPGEARDGGPDRTEDLDAGAGTDMFDGSTPLDAAIDPRLDWVDVGWAYRKELRVRAASGADLSDFPLLVSLSDADLRDHVGHENGEDIFFADAEQSRLDHERELFTAASGTLVAWVRIPQLSSSAETVLYMYYGNPELGLADQQNATSVWDASFVTVHHLSGTSDSSRYHHDASAIGTPDFRSAGGIGVSAILDGSSGFQLGDIDEIDGVVRMTLSAWFRMDAILPLQLLFGELDEDSDDGWGLSSGRTGAGAEGADDLAFGLGTVGPDGTGDVTTLNLLSAGTLTYCAVTFDGSAAAAADRRRIYVNGVEVQSKEYPMGLASPAATPDTGYHAYIGTTPSPPNLSLVGMIDEVRFSSSLRSAAWIATEYANQRDPATFVLAGIEEPR